MKQTIQQSSHEMMLDTLFARESQAIVYTAMKRVESIVPVFVWPRLNAAGCV